MVWCAHPACALACSPCTLFVFYPPRFTVQDVSSVGCVFTSQCVTQGTRRTSVPAECMQACRHCPLVSSGHWLGAGRIACACAAMTCLGPAVPSLSNPVCGACCEQLLLWSLCVLCQCMRLTGRPFMTTVCSRMAWDHPTTCSFHEARATVHSVHATWRTVSRCVSLILVCQC